MAPVAMLQFIKVRRSQNNTDHFLVSIYKLLLLCSFLSGIDLFSLGQPYLWARLDRRPNKQTEKRFKKYQHSHKSCKGRITLSKTVPPRFLNTFFFGNIASTHHHGGFLVTEADSEPQFKGFNNSIT